MSELHHATAHAIRFNDAMSNYNISSEPPEMAIFQMHNHGYIPILMDSSMRTRVELGIFWVKRTQPVALGGNHQISGAV
jgi:hypothetical protein